MTVEGAPALRRPLGARSISSLSGGGTCVLHARRAPHPSNEPRLTERRPRPTILRAKPGALFAGERPQLQASRDGERRGAQPQEEAAAQGCRWTPRTRRVARLRRRRRRHRGRTACRHSARAPRSPVPGSVPDGTAGLRSSRRTRRRRQGRGPRSECPPPRCPWGSRDRPSARGDGGRTAPPRAASPTRPTMRAPSCGWART